MDGTPDPLLLNPLMKGRAGMLMKQRIMNIEKLYEFLNSTFSGEEAVKAVRNCMLLIHFLCYTVTDLDLSNHDGVVVLSSCLMILVMDHLEKEESAVHKRVRAALIVDLSWFASSLELHEGYPI